MDILDELEQKERELTACYSIIQLQEHTIKELSNKVAHLEKLLLHPALILDKKD